MLTVHGRRQRFCDGVTRRSFLKIGGFVMGSQFGLALPDLLRAEAASGKRAQHKALINIYLPGGPAHHETWDMKPDAPAEFRGPLEPISTNVPGIQICELFGRLAAKMDKFAIVRSIYGCEENHDGYQCNSGWLRGSLNKIGGRPGIGPVAWKLKGAVHPGMPSHIGLSKTQYANFSESGSPGFLGPAYAAFKPHPFGLHAGSYHYSRNLSLNDMKLNGITLERLQDRRNLLRQIDGLRHEVDASGLMEGIDHYTQTAFDVLTSSKLVDALDLSKEDPKVRESYGDGKPFGYTADASLSANENFLLARRLVEAGARTVSVSYGQWDHHSNLEPQMRHFCPRLDQGIVALVEDLDQRGMLDDVTVIAWGEFGRTPRFNDKAGRDHWPQANCALLAGGGMQVGQVIGETDRIGERPADRPVHVHQVISTLYHNLGIDAMTTTVDDPSGRPRYLVEHREPITELI